MVWVGGGNLAIAIHFKLHLLGVIIQPYFHQYITNFGYQLGAFADQPIGELAGGRVNTARHAKYFPILFQSVIYGPTSAASFAGFSNQRSQCHPADDAVATGKVGCFWPNAENKLADQGATLGEDTLSKPTIFAGIHDIQTVAQHRYRATAGVQHGGMRTGIDAQGETAHHRYVSGSKRRAKIGSDAAAVLGRSPGAHHRNRSVIFQQQRALDVQHGRSVCGFREAHRVRGITPRQRDDPTFRQPFEFLVGFYGVASRNHILSNCSTDSGGSEFTGGCGPRFGKVALEVRFQQPKSRRTQARHLTQRNPTTQITSRRYHGADSIIGSK